MNDKLEKKSETINKDTESLNDVELKEEIEKSESNKEENNHTLSENDNDKSDISNDEQNDEQENITNEEKLQGEIEQLRDEKLRLLAEMENIRKRSDKDKIDAIRYGSFNLARDILSPDDNLTRALEVIPKEDEKIDSVKNLIKGLKMVQKEFSTILEKYGVKKIEALNNKFDHNFHQAMVEIENNDVDTGTIIQEMQSGYIMHDRLLRPSMVGVSKKKEKDEENEKN